MHSHLPAGPAQPGAAPAPPSYPPGAPPQSYGSPPPGTVPPPYGSPPPAGAPYSYGAGPPGPPAAPGKPKGGARTKVGVVLMVLGFLPFVAGVGIEAKNISNAQQMVGNNDFAPKAWHNLEGGQIFPDYLTDKNTQRKIQGWSRQGVAEETTCTDSLRKDIAQAIEQAGCKTVLRATYVDFSGEIAATLALIVLDSYDDAAPLAERWSKFDSPGPLVEPVPFPGTPSENWKADYAMAGGAQTTGLPTTEAPYILSLSVGPIDGTRSVGELPEPWAMQGREEVERYEDMAVQLLGAFSGSFSWTMEGK
jgi:hypothetical protein